jgi:hypothetical protein
LLILISSVELPGLNNWSELHVDTDLAFDCDALMEEYDRLPGMRLVTCVSRGEVDDSDAADDSTEGSTEDESATGGEEDTGDEEQSGDDNGSAHTHATGAAAVLVASIVIIGLTGV